MKRWLLSLALLSLSAAPATTYWHSVHQVSSVVTPPCVGYTGPGDLVAGASGFWGLRGYACATSGAIANICDVATGLVCADITWAAGVITVPQIGGVTCDNAAAKCQVKTLYDQTGALACAGAACDITQSVATRRPTLIIPGVANGCPTDSMYCMAFVLASSQCFTSGAALYTQAIPISLSFVGTRTGNTGAIQSAVTVNAANTLAGWSNAADTIRMTAGGAVTKAAVVDNAWHAVQAALSDTVGALAADGSTTAGNTGTTGAAGTPMTVGATTNTCSLNRFDGKMVEAGVWPAAFSAGNITALNSNQHTYWGF